MAITTTAEIASRLSATSALLTIGNADVFSVADAVEAVKTKWPKDNSGPVE